MSHYDYPDLRTMGSAELINHFTSLRKAKMAEQSTPDNSDQSILARVGPAPWEIVGRGSTEIPDPIPLPIFPAIDTNEKRVSTMDIWMVWARDGSDPEGILWLETAWDDDLVSGNPDGWQAEVEKAYSEWGGNNVRVTKTTVDFDKVSAAFEPTEV